MLFVTFMIPYVNVASWQVGSPLGTWIMRGIYAVCVSSWLLAVQVHSPRLTVALGIDGKVFRVRSSASRTPRRAPEPLPVRGTVPTTYAVRVSVL